MNSQCDSCRFWANPRDGVGECRRNAPAPVQRAQITDDANSPSDNAPVWPVTVAADWCGQYSTK